MLYFLNVGTVPMLYFLNIGTVPTSSHSQFGRGVYGVIYPKLVVIELLPQLKSSQCAFGYKDHYI